MRSRCGGLGVFSTYHNNPEATAESFTADGWFRTGDIGTLDDDGYLRITGRKKELIVTAGGKNVAPTQLEDRLRGHPLISQVLVVGDGEPFIAALITLDKEMLPQWLRNHGLPTMDVIEASTHPAGARRPGPGRGAYEPRGLPGRVDPRLQGADHRLHRGQRSAHALAEGQARSGDGGPRGRHRRHLQLHA